MYKHYFVSFAYVSSGVEYSGNCEHITIKKLKNFEDIKKLQKEIAEGIEKDYKFPIESLVITGFQQTKRSLFGKLS